MFFFLERKEEKTNEYLMREKVRQTKGWKKGQKSIATLKVGMTFFVTFTATEFTLHIPREGRANDFPGGLRRGGGATSARTWRAGRSFRRSTTKSSCTPMACLRHVRKPTCRGGPLPFGTLGQLGGSSQRLSLFVQML